MMSKIPIDLSLPIDPDNDFFEIKTRILDVNEVWELHYWLIGLPFSSWSVEDSNNALEHLLESRRAFVTLPQSLKREAIYCKVKWG